MIASVITLGCKVNEYESQSILAQLKENGYCFDRLKDCMRYLPFLHRFDPNGYWEFHL